MQDIFQYFKGTFVIPPEALLQRLSAIKAFVFDWDGVFNNGNKDEQGSSPFSEVDSMGVNMLRFAHYLVHDRPPVTAVITGEKNRIALNFAKREHFDMLYAGIRHKDGALQHFCDTHSLKPAEVAFFFDDVIDLSITPLCGLRIMVGQQAGPLFSELVVRNGHVDYITAAKGGDAGLREGVELLVGMSGKYEELVHHRAAFSPLYQQYLAERNKPEVQLFTVKDSVITHVSAL